MCPSPVPPLKPRWLACPANREQTDAYWQAVSMCRSMGIELELHPLVHSPELPWQRLRRDGRWCGLVLWPDDTGERLHRQAQAQGVHVRCFSTDPHAGLQPWSVD